MRDDVRTLGNLRSSERLISELYIDLRKRVNTWAAITNQTAQARMGYVGQHLVSVVTGFPGGKSGARGHDLVLPNDEYGEIKTCYRVDQLGRCNSCDARIASIERQCPDCGTDDIKRNDDSKWLIGIRHDEEFAELLEPESYYLVLFDFVDLSSPDTIRSSIWEVDPKSPGFGYCMVDYRIHIQATSRSKAAFNLWPYQLKFSLMKPMLIYQSTISTADDSIRTTVFPGRNQTQLHGLGPLPEYSRSTNLTLEKIRTLAQLLGIPGRLPDMTKRNTLDYIQNYVNEQDISPAQLADKVATALYMNGIEAHIPGLREPLRSRIQALASTI